jgi:hypothetical protein
LLLNTCEIVVVNCNLRKGPLGSANKTPLYNSRRASLTKLGSETWTLASVGS